MFDYIYFNYFSTGWLINAFFYGALALYALTLPKKSKATLHLGIAFLFATMAAFIYIFSASFYNKIASIHRYFTILVVSGIMIHTCQALLYFTKLGSERIKKTILIIMWVTILVPDVIFIIQSFNAEYIFHFDGHYWDFSLDRTSAIIGLIILITDLVTICIGIYSVIRAQGKKRLVLTGMVISLLVLTIGPAIVNILSRNGAISRGMFLFMLNFFSMIGYFAFVILYINNIKDRTSFMAKIVGLTLITTLVIMLGLNHYMSTIIDESYDATHQQQVMRILFDKNFRPDDLEYIIEYNITTGSFLQHTEKKCTIDFTRLKQDFLQQLIPGATPDIRRYREGVGKQHYVSYMQIDSEKNKIFEVGFSYISYRKHLHTHAGIFSLLLILVFITIVFGFPLFFLGTLIIPIKSLQNGLQKIREGNLNVQIPVKVEDEIGFLTERFNSMVITIKDYTNNLEKMVEERTYEIKEANEKLREMDKIKTNFFSNISHEIRTPLTLILSPIESFLQGDYKKEIDREFFLNIQKNAIRLLRLVNNLLDFSKIEEGRMTMHIKEFDMVKVAKNYVNTVQPAAESRGIQLALESTVSSLPLFLDIEKADKIAMNLFSNALKFTEKNGKIELRIYDDEKNCYIDVKDNGTGIPQNMLTSIFERFKQADSSSTRKYEGSGIGLSLAKELVEMHGGSLSVFSKYIDNHPNDHGTVFTVSFPKGKKHFEGVPGVDFITGNKVEESITDRKVYYGMREMIEFQGMTATSSLLPGPLPDRERKEISHGHILIVDDNKEMRDFLTMLLEKNYQISCAIHGKDGLEKAKKIAPDIIITDVMMPVMDGYEMTRQIKKDIELQGVPVIMLTAKTEIAQKIEGLEYGADDYLTKPFNSKELLTRIKSLLEKTGYQKLIIARNIQIEEELATARLLQQKLLPEKIEALTGYRTAAKYIPMDKVGGDFYDYKVTDTIIEIFIADVSGHGLPGAFLSMITKIAFESMDERKSTKEILYRLNDIICRSTVKNNYITFFYSRIDRSTNTMTFSNAGHFPPFIYREKNNTFYDLNTRGHPLGISTDAKFEQDSIQLQTNDRVIFYTDGITECRDSQGELFGEERFKKFVQENTVLAPEQFTEKLLAAVKKFSDSDNFDDDLCLVVVDIC